MITSHFSPSHSVSSLQELSVGFIGTGRMGSALGRGLVASHDIVAEKLFLLSGRGASAAALAKELGCHHAATLQDLVAAAEVIFLCVKPHLVREVLDGLQEELAGKILISVAAGVPLDSLEELVGENVRVVRAMPNTAVGLQQGVTSLVWGKRVTEEDRRVLTSLFATLGTHFEIEEALMDVATALAGSGPAFAYLFLEGLVEGATAEGMEPDLARKMAAAMLRSSAAMSEQKQESFEELRSEVTSPGGTTAAGLSALAAGDFLKVTQSSVVAATQRAKELGAR